MNKPFICLALLSLLLPLGSCAPKKAKPAITIVYTNDIHGYIDNATKDEAGEEVDALRFSKLSGYVKELRKKDKNVLLVDAGDEVQGAVYGSLDRGKEIIPIMNEVGYQLATPGNHDFDFGMEGFESFVETASFPYISCNFVSLPDEELVLEPYKIFDFDGVKVGFIGISTPETITSSTPRFFQNDEGEYIYAFLGYEDPNDLYQRVQLTIDELKDQTDYLIALGHVGVNAECIARGYSSPDVIANTSGLNAFIDGHSHTRMEERWVDDKEGNRCLLTQTGCYLASFGQLTISPNGAFSSRLISDSPFIDTKVQSMENTLISRVKEEMGQSFATLENPLYIADPEVPSRRLIRAKETNLADLCSDSMYWYLNEKKELPCDLTLVNGGGIRTGIPAGEVTYLAAMSVHPFGNQICLVKASGQDILDAIEMGAIVSGQWDADRDGPSENGGFLHLAGITYDIDTAIPSSVVTDENGMFVSVEGEYRVKNVKVFDREAKAYVPFDPEKEYCVGGSNYLLKESGCGLSMFADCEGISDYIDADYVVLAEYMKAFESSAVNNLNAPLKAYENYLYDYENPAGSGRIRFLA